MKKPTVISTAPTPQGAFTPYAIGFAVAAIMFIGAALLALQNKGMTGWEIALFDAINGMPNSLRIVGLVATVAPESVLIGAVVVAGTFFARMYRLSLRLAIAILGGYVATAIVKHFIGRPRPGEILQDISLRAHDTAMGFPSGHTMIVTVIVLIVMPYLPSKWKWLVLLPIIIMAWSRIYLGLHAPLDILGGFAIGLGVVCFLRILPQAVKKLLRLDK